MKQRPNRWARGLLALFLVPVWLSYASGEMKSAFERGTEYLRAKKLDEAIAELTQAVSEKPGHSEAYNNRGLAYLEKEDLTQAEADFQKAIECDANNGRAHNNLGNIDYHNDKYAEAKTHYEQALAASSETLPFHAEVYNNLGIINERLNLPADAEQAYGNAIQVVNDLQLDYTAAYYNRGNLYYDQEKYLKAIDDYTVTINFYGQAKTTDAPHLADAYYNRGLSHYNLGNYDAAISDYDQAIQFNPNFVWAHYSKGYAHYMLGQHDTALSCYNTVETFAASEPNHPAIPWNFFAKGLAYQSKGDASKYLNNMQKSCDLGNETACDRLK